MKINEITLNPQMVNDLDPVRFRVGESVIEGGHVVEKINYHPANRVFNKGLEIGGGCYAIYLVDIPERRIIMEGMVTSVEVVKEAKAEANTEASVDLPAN